jgi:hypothetical protein
MLMSRHFPRGWRLASYIAIALLVVVGATVSPYLLLSGGSAAPDTHAVVPPESIRASAKSAHVCGQPVLHSPYSYDGATRVTPFTSGEHGLPSFGAPDTDYPDVRVGYVVPPGDDSAVSADLLNGSRALIYFEPGGHTGLPGIAPGDYSVYIGGYLPRSGEAALDNDGQPGNTFISDASHVTIEYLTVDNFDGTPTEDSFGGAIVDEYGGYGWTVDYDTVGPNGDFLGSPDTGYGIGIGSASKYEYDCVIRNGEGGFNNGTGTATLRDPAPWGGPADYLVEHDEISGNAIATCQVSWKCARGVWGDPDGVAAGIKVFWSLNGTIDQNYIHDNYGDGVWPDTNNSGIDISGNYISDNLESAIDYEASFNANISHNTITGNGWNPKGRSEWAGWPNGYQTSNGGGPDFADGAIYIDNSGGAPDVLSGSTRYRGELHVTGNDLINNFGGIIAFQDRNRFCGEGPDGGQGTCTLNGHYSRGNATGAPYYAQPTSYADDATVSTGSDALSSAAGFLSNYTGKTTAPGAGWIVAAFDPSSGNALSGIFPVGETIASCSGPTSCTLTKPATAGVRRGQVEIESGPPGGCGMYDLMGSDQGKLTGSPRAQYFAGCNWWVQDLLVSDNYLGLTANPSITWIAGKVTNCTRASGCGYMTLYANIGACTTGCFWSPYSGETDARYITSASARNTWQHNTYVWKGPGCWQFEAGPVGHVLPEASWRGSVDSGSTYVCSAGG